MRPQRILIAAMLATGLMVQGCASDPADRKPAPVVADAIVLQGWETCFFACEQSFIAAYSKFNFLRLDDRLLGGVPELVLSPGRHWVEAHYAWGGGITALGIGNYRGYGFEFDAVPGHRYSIREVPAGCVVPASRNWVSLTALRMEDRFGNGPPEIRTVKAMEYCSPSASSGTCQSNADCGGNVCTSFEGTIGYGFCGERR